MNDFHDSTPDQAHPDDEWVSKTQRKREAEALQKLGERLTHLREEQRNALPLSDTLREGIDTYLRIKSHEARRRQLQYIGKVMKAENLDAIREAVDRLDSTTEAYARIHHHAEHWRARLLSDDKSALTEFLEAHPGLDIQSLRTLIRNAKKDQETGKNRGNLKKLYQAIREASVNLPDS
ncbi:MAG: DUF615 domain-containing protein [Gammaproteobacteria bacterium]|nr:MAG: DUF615 domain-containing protein [Gammaproteobacteria bacterium]